MVRLSFFQQAQRDSIMDIGARPKTHERRGVMSVKARHGIYRSLIESLSGVRIDAEDADVHAEYFVTRHRFIDIEWHRAEILADDLRLMAM